MHHCLPRKNAPIWRPPLTPQSTCRSSNRRLHDSSRRPSKIRGLWYNTHLNRSRPPNQRTKLPFHHSRLMRNHYSRLNLSTTDRPKISHRLLFSQPHGPSRSGNFNPNTLRIHRGSHPHNRPRPHVLRPFLSSQHQLRTYPQSNDNPCTRPTNGPSSHDCLMIHCQSRQSSTTPSPQLNRRTNNYCFPIKLILMDTSPHRGRHPHHRRIFPLHIPNNPTRPNPCPHYFSRTLPLPRTSPHSPPSPPTTSSDYKTRTSLGLNCL